MITSALATATLLHITAIAALMLTNEVDPAEMGMIAGKGTVVGSTDEVSAIWTGFCRLSKFGLAFMLG